MSLSKLLPIPAGEHFQNIRWKVVFRDGEDLVPQFKKSLFTTGRKKCSVRYRGGVLFCDDMIDRVDFQRRIKCEDTRDMYPCGVHAYTSNPMYNPLWSDNPRHEVVPILISDIVAYGTQGSFEMTVVVGRLVYFLTPGEYVYLTTDHKPIKISDTVEVAEV